MTGHADASPPQRLTEQATRWGVIVDEVEETSSSLIAFGRRDARPVVLKVVKVEGDEWHSGAIVRAFAGRGMVRVEEHVPGALLLERLSPAESLVTMSRGGDDVAATEILASVVGTMRPGPAPAECPRVADWGKGFSRYLSTADTQVDRALVVRAGEAYASLCDAQLNVRLLHGDLQHDNILRDQRRGWLAIDPKGVIGEVEYELGAFLRNPGEVPSLFLDAEVTERRAVQLATALDCDATRVLQWAFTQAVLSAIWSVEDREPLASPAPILLFAETVERIVGRS